MAAIGNYTRQQFEDLYDRLIDLQQELDFDDPDYERYEEWIGQLDLAMNGDVEDEDEEPADLSQTPQSQQLYATIIRWLEPPLPGMFFGRGYFHVMPKPIVRCP
jgi:hypothetical protein